MHEASVSSCSPNQPGGKTLRTRVYEALQSLARYDCAQVILDFP